MNVRSLSAIELNTADIDLYVDPYDAAKPKLRARIRDAGVLYDLSVPAAAQRAIWKNHGVAAAMADVKTAARTQVRIGLCRAFGGKCYAQINGFIAV